MTFNITIFSFLLFCYFMLWHIKGWKEICDNNKLFSIASNCFKSQGVPTSHRSDKLLLEIIITEIVLRINNLYKSCRFEPNVWIRSINVSINGFPDSLRNGYMQGSCLQNDYKSTGTLIWEISRKSLIIVLLSIQRWCIANIYIKKFIYSSIWNINQCGMLYGPILWSKEIPGLKASKGFYTPIC